LPSLPGLTSSRALLGASASVLVSVRAFDGDYATQKERGQITNRIYTTNKRRFCTVHLIYLDDSADETTFAFSAIAIPIISWHDAFSIIRDFRRDLRQQHGIYIYKELHAWKFVSGRGNISDRVVTKFARAEVFKQTLQMLTTLPGVQLFNCISHPHRYQIAFEWLLNRINRTLETWSSYGILISDQGKEDTYTRLMRRMYIYNPIPSRFGIWQDTEQSYKNIPLRRLVEDPFFKDSSRSYLVQLADFCAYALLRKQNPVESKTRYGLDTAFDILEPIVVRAANPRDSLGIIRPT
jgi:hypothetical protein